MNVGFQVGQMQGLNVHRINQSLAAQTGATPEAEEVKKARFDTVSISPQGKMNQFLESLMKQKQEVTERKNNLISTTLEKGGSMDSIKSELEAYEEQLQGIEQQVADLTAQALEKQAETPKPKDSKDEPKTEEERAAQKLNQLANLASDVSQAKAVSSVKSKMDGNARVLSSEIELDKGRGASPELIEKKQSKLTNLEQRSNKLAGAIAEKLAETGEALTDSELLQKTAAAEEANAGTEQPSTEQPAETLAVERP